MPYSKVAEAKQISVPFQSYSKMKGTMSEERKRAGNDYVRNMWVTCRI